MSALAKSLLAFQKDAPQIHTDSSGNFSNKYVSLPALMDAIRGSLAANGLMLIQKPTVLENGAPGLITKLLHESGEEEQAIMPLLLDRQNPQGLGSALTYARRQAALAFLGLAADSDDDANAATNFQSATGRPVVGGPSSEAERSGPTPSEADAHGLQASRADNVDATPGDASDKQKAMIRRLAKKLNLPAGDVDGLGKREASAKIEELLAVEAGTGEAVAVGGGAVDDDIPF